MFYSKRQFLNLDFEKKIVLQLENPMALRMQASYTTLCAKIILTGLK